MLLDAGAGASPAFVLDTQDSRHAWQYAMPADSPTGLSTKGIGLGEYRAVEGPESVVAVVGSAHVGGIVREWQDIRDISGLSELLGSEEEKRP